MATIAASCTSLCACSFAGGRSKLSMPAFRSRGTLPRRQASQRKSVQAQGTGQDAVGSWIDLASFVSSGGNSGGRTPYDELADRIGRDVYIDVAGWHLYLKDVKVGQGLSLAQGLAAQLGPKLQAERRFRETDLDMLKKVPIKLGGGKVVVSLAEVMPSGCMRDLERACEDYARDS